jgi:D-alanyl-D-alanine carboxypeptidase
VNTVDNLDDFVAARMEAEHIPGLALALTDRRQTLRVATYGFANLESRAPVRPETLFEFGSIGKSFTSIALLQESAAGHLDLDAPVTRYLPWFTVQSRHAPITPRHLLSHTAGITCGSDFSPDSRGEVYALRDTWTSAPPGDYFHYSNVGYKALGLLLEHVSGRSYAEIIGERILAPLGMVNTVAAITGDIRPRLAVGYEPFFDDRPAPPNHPLAPAPWFETATADGCLAATAGDLAIYLRMLLNRGAYPGDRLIDEASFARLIAPLIPAWGTRHYSLGLATWQDDGHTIVGHGGGMPGFFSSISGDLDAGLGAAVLINGPANPHAIADAALAMLRAAHNGAPPSSLAMPPDPTLVEGASYAGTYASGQKAFRIRAEDGRVILDDGAVRLPLRMRLPDHFAVDHPAYARHLLRFARAGDTVVEAFHGPDWYTNERYAGPAAPAYPAAWPAYVGHYRAHNPWLSNFRVVLRKGALALLSYPEGLEMEEPLAPIAGDTFRVGDDERVPETVRFSDLVEGHALRATLAMGQYYRFFTP